MSNPQRHRLRTGIVLLLGFCAPVCGCTTLWPGRHAAAPSAETTFSSEDSAVPTKDQTVFVPAVLKARSEVQWSITPGAGQDSKGMEGKGMVGPDGTLELGPYGSLQVAGLTEKLANAALERHLRQYLRNSKASLRLSVQDNVPAPVPAQSTVEWRSDGQGLAAHAPQMVQASK